MAAFLLLAVAFGSLVIPLVSILRAGCAAGRYGGRERLVSGPLVGGGGGGAGGRRPVG
jgi:hypothetical protein